METGGVEQVVRSVLKYYGLADTIREISPTQSGWNCVLRDPAGNDRSFFIGNNPPHAIRRAVIAFLEIEPD